MASKRTPDGKDVASDRHTLEGARAFMAARTAASHAVFFLSHLKSGMSLLDAGCGSGSITFGLAEAVAPGQVVGVDVATKQIEGASAAAEARGITNVVFQTGNVYEMPFPDDSFDAVFSHAVLEHLSNPLRALKEFRRVLTPGGIVGVRAPDVSGNLADPAWHEPTGVKIMELMSRLIEHNGGNWYVGREMKRLLREAAFQIEELGASYNCSETPESLRQFAQMVAATVCGGTAADQLVELGWTDREELERTAQWALSWAEGPDAFHARAYVHGVGRKL